MHDALETFLVYDVQPKLFILFPENPCVLKGWQRGKYSATFPHQELLIIRTLDTHTSCGATMCQAADLIVKALG